MITISVKGLDELQARFKTLPKDVQKIASASLEEGARLFVRGAQRDAPKDVGFLKGQVSYAKINDLSFKVVSGSAYAAFMEFGTKGRVVTPPEFTKYAGTFVAGGTGKTGQGFYDSILAWVKRKGFAATKTKSGRSSTSLDSRIAQEQAAFAIYLSIIRHGVKPHPYFFKQSEPAKAQIETSLQKINEIKL